MRRPIVPVVLAVLLVPAAVAAPRGFYRCPTIRGATIVFAAEGDLWRVPVGGGAAQRLTSHLADEEDPALRRIASTCACSSVVLPGWPEHAAGKGLARGAAALAATP